VPVVVTFESDWRAAKRILEEVAHECAEHLSPDAERTLRRAAREYFIFYSKLTPVVYTSVVAEGVRLTMRYLVAPRRVRGSEQDVWEAVLDHFAGRQDIDLAYPTTRLYRNDLEGKPGREKGAG
jgi:small-conductance mechanosensitive channel